LRSASLAAFLACTIAAALPSTSFAAEDAVTRKKVQTYLDLSGDLFKAGDFEGALTELRRAEALSDLAVVRYNIARCLEELHRDGEAIAAFEKYLALNDTTAGAPERQKRAQDTIPRLQATAAAALPSTLGSLEIACPTAGSSVMVIGLMQTPVGCPWKSDKVPAGAYDVQTMAPGHQPVLTRAEVAAGRTTAVIAQANRASAQQVPAAVMPPTATAGAPVPVKFLVARDGDEMDVVVDGNPELACKAPCEIQLTPGRHTVAVTGAAKYVDTINVPRGDPSTAKLGRSRVAFLIVGLSSLAVGVTSAVVGLYLFSEEAQQYGTVSVPGVALLGTGIVIAVVGSIVGFKLKGSNGISLERDRGRGRGERDQFSPQLLSVGLAPTRGGAMAGATFAF